MVVSPGSDLRYLTGYDAKPLERLTALLVRADADAVMVVPALELLAAQASPLTDLGMQICAWSETEDPIALSHGLLGNVGAVAVDAHMWADRLLAFRQVAPSARFVSAASVIDAMRMRKDPQEIQALMTAGAAIDSVHAGMAQWLRPGRTEAEVGADIHAAILAAGHASVDFVIVGSGPNGASPHHELSDRVICGGDVVVVDIGGTMPSGYCSDSTRTYVIGNPLPEFLDRYSVLQAAQAAQVAAVAPGRTCQEIDGIGRSILAEAGMAELFIHRTGHGIGLLTHEEPYIVEGNTLPLEPGMAFSIEPGFYVVGQFGARIEDIVICTPDGGLPVNHRPHELITL